MPHCSYQKAEGWLGSPSPGGTSVYARKRSGEIAALKRMYAYVNRRAGKQDRQRTSDEQLSQRFSSLADAWADQTAHMSLLTQRATHATYQSIIALGPKVVPLILQRLEAQPDYWFWALRFLTGQNPVHPDDAGDFPAMTRAWLDWGRVRGHI